VNGHFDVIVNIPLCQTSIRHTPSVPTLSSCWPTAASPVIGNLDVIVNIPSRQTSIRHSDHSTASHAELFRRVCSLCAKVIHGASFSSADRRRRSRGHRRPPWLSFLDTSLFRLQA